MKPASYFLKRLEPDEPIQQDILQKIEDYFTYHPRSRICCVSNIINKATINHLIDLGYSTITNETDNLSIISY
jgi:hypothetical protein